MQKTVSAKEKDQIIESYISGKSTQKVADDSGWSRWTIRTILKQRKVQTRSDYATPRRTCLREDAFSTVTPESAYWIGFLMADGWTDGKGTLGCSLAKQDEAHLEKLTRFLGTDQPITNAVWKGSWSSRLRICSSKMVNDLKGYGVVERKSLTACVKGLEGNRHFWRGVMDGDGWIYFKQSGLPIVSLCGSRNLLQQFCSWCESIGIQNRNLIKDRGIFQVSMSGKNAQTIARALYRIDSDCEQIESLDRKRILADRILGWKTQMPNRPAANRLNALTDHTQTA